MPDIPLDKVTFKHDWKIESGYNNLSGAKTFQFFAMINGKPVRTAAVSCHCSDAACILRAMVDVLDYEKHLPA